MNYYRCVMWLGAADTAWYVTPPHPDSGLVSNCQRELRNALLFVDVVSAAGQLEQLEKIERAVVLSDRVPPRSAWVSSFQPPAAPRAAHGP